LIEILGVGVRIRYRDRFGVYPDLGTHGKYDLGILYRPLERRSLRATPTHFLLDSKGRVLLKQTGYKPGEENVFEQKIQEELNPTR
jgi:hypothetical protein